MSASLCLKADLPQQDLLYKLSHLSPSCLGIPQRHFSSHKTRKFWEKKLPRKCLWNQISSREELSILIFPWRRVHTGFTAASLKTIGTSKRCIWQECWGICCWRRDPAMSAPHAAPLPWTALQFCCHHREGGWVGERGYWDRGKVPLGNCSWHLALEHQKQQALSTLSQRLELAKREELMYYSLL